MKRYKHLGKGILALGLAFSAAVAGAFDSSVVDNPLAEAREVLWTTLRDRFFCEKTEMLYDVLWQADDGTVSATACLPTPAEAARQYPNPCSWGTGLQDCVFNGGPYLAVALARGDRVAAQSIFRGLRRCAEVSGVPGFVARGVLPSDGKGYYINSSRDVWTLFVFYLWRYYHSDLCDAPTRETIRRLVVDVARYAESCVRPENGYNMLRADGKVGLATQMWVKNPKCRPWTDKAGWDFFEGLRVHEALRLPMFYAAAFDLSGDVHWREMALRYLDDGIAMAGGKIGPDIRASVLNQMQLSNRLLWETETDPDRKARLLRLLNRAADIARDHVTTRLAQDFAAGKWQVSKPIPDWHKAGFRSRNWGDGGVLNGYRYDIPDQPVFSIEDGYVEASHALLVQAMTPDRKIDGRTLRLFREATEQMDFSEVACANAVNALLAMYQKGLDAALAAAVTESASAADPVVVQSSSNGYNAWPIVQTVGEKIICAYSRGTAHHIAQGVRGVYARVSSDGGATWGDEVTVANDAAYGEVAIGRGLDVNGAMLLWVRCWGGADPHHDLYRTTDGVSFEKIATPALDPVPMQITDIFAVPGVGLMCLWFSDGYASGSVRSWGKLVSADNGLTWTRTTVETGLVTDEWPTEPSGVWLGDGKILVIARCEGADRQFQIVSTDSGATWTKRQTNITDVRMSTPSLVYDATKGLVSNYYYQRGAKMLKRRVALAADVFGHPDQWPQPELLYTGEESVAIDAGNVNVTVMSDGTHLATTYTGTSSNTKVIALAVATPSRPGVLMGSMRPGVHVKAEPESFFGEIEFQNITVNGVEQSLVR